MRALALVVLLSGSALALPKAGSTLPPVSVATTAGKLRMLPDAYRPVLVMYEDREAAPQNQPARQLLGRYTRRVENRAIFEFVAVADVSKWNWWPPRRYALKELRAQEEKNNTTVYADWDGSVRKVWGLQKGRSAVLLLDANGRLHFAAEGSLSADQLTELEAALRALGATPVGF